MQKKLTITLAASVSLFAVTAPASAQVAPAEDDAWAASEIVVTAARSVLPANALPLTVDVIGNDELSQQVAIPVR